VRARRQPGRADLTLPERHSGGGTLLPVSGALTLRGIEVEALDAFIDLLPAGAPLVIKLDLEGYEWTAIQGMRRTLAERDVRALIIEKDTEWTLEGRGRLADFTELFGAYGLRPFDISVRRVLPGAEEPPGVRPI
jgi:hypothetical protein